MQSIDAALAVEHNTGEGTEHAFLLEEVISKDQGKFKKIHEQCIHCPTVLQP